MLSHVVCFHAPDLCGLSPFTCICFHLLPVVISPLLFRQPCSLSSSPVLGSTSHCPVTQFPYPSVPLPSGVCSFSSTPPLLLSEILSPSSTVVVRLPSRPTLSLRALVSGPCSSCPGLPFTCPRLLSLLSQTYFRSINGLQYLTDTDIFIAFTCNGVSVHKGLGAQHSKTQYLCFPLKVIILNLPPMVCTQNQYVFSLGVILGPRKLKHLNSFCWPFYLECRHGIQGICTYHMITHSFFPLHFFVPHGFGNLIAVIKMKSTCGVSAKKPCHQCHVEGIRDKTSIRHRIGRECHIDVCLDVTIPHKVLVLCLPASIVFKLIDYKFKLNWFVKCQYELF